MNCEHAIERMGERLDGVLPQAEAAELDGHLASCAACRAAMEDLRRSIEAVKALPKVKAPRGFAASVMAEIRAEEDASRNRAPAKVTPISVASVWTRLAATAAAILLVWVGVRAIHTDPPATGGDRPGVAVQDKDKARETGSEPGKLGKNLEGTNDRGRAGEGPAADVERLNKEAALAVLEAAKSKAQQSPAAPQDKAAAGAGAGAGGGWNGPAAGRNSAISVQRVVVHSADVAGDRKQIEKLLSESGYTWTEQGGALILRAPASEASRFVASLDTAAPGGFRAGARKPVGAEQAEKGGAPANGVPPPADARGKAADEALVADASELKDALRRHLEESEKQIQKQENEKRRKAVAKDAPAGKPYEGKEGAGLGDRQDGGAPALGGADHNEASQEDSKSEKKDAGRNEDPKTPEPAAPMTGGVEDGFGKGGTDELGSKIKKEHDLDDEVEREVRKLEEKKKLADQEEAVVIYIEFAEDAMPAKPVDPSPAKK